MDLLIKEGFGMLLTIAIVLGILWLLGVVVHIGGGLINLVLLIALIIFIYDLVTGRRGKV